MLGFGPIASYPIAGLFAGDGEGATIFLPLDAIRTASHAVAVRSGARVGLPVSEINVSHPAVRVAISATVSLPADAILTAHFAPVVRSGASVSLPVSAINMAHPAVSVRSGARIDLPLSQILTSGPRIELNARRRRVKTQIIQS